MNWSRNSWRDGARASILLILGATILAFVLPIYQEAARPTPTPYAPTGFLGLVVDKTADDVAEFKMSLESVVDGGGNRPSDRAPSRVEFEISLQDSTPENSRTTLLFAGGFGAAIGVCDQGKPRDVPFGQLTEFERASAIKYLQRTTSSNVTSDPLEVAKIAESLPYRYLAFDMATSSTKKIVCDLLLDRFMETKMTSRVFAVPAMLMAIKYERVSTAQANVFTWRPEHLRLSREVRVSPQEYTTFKEGYPAPSQRTPERITWSEQDTGMDDSFSQSMYIQIDSVTGRFGDEGEDADQKMRIFWAGALLGLAGSLVASGLIAIVDSLFSLEGRSMSQGDLARDRRSPAARPTAGAESPISPPSNERQEGHGRADDR